MSEDYSSRQWKRWLRAAIKLLIVGLVVWFVHRTLIVAWQQLGQSSWHFNLPWLMLAGLLYLAGTLFSGLFWHRVLRAMGQNAGLAETLRAYYIGHLGKYVPGKAMVVVLRTGLIRSHRVDTTVAAVSVFFETLTMMAVGAFLAAAIVAIWFREQSTWFWASVAMMFLSGIPTLPPVFRRLVRLLRVGKSNAVADQALTGLGYDVALSGWALNTIGWVFLALSLWAVLRSLGADGARLSQLHIYLASVSLATVAGFVSLVPAGVVVREAVLLALIGPLSGEGIALVSTLLLRLVWLVSELGISGILYLGSRQLRPRRPLPPSEG